MDPTKMVKAHVMHIIIHKCEILFCRHGKEPVKVMTGYNTQHICIVKTALVPYKSQLISKCPYEKSVSSKIRDACEVRQYIK